MNRKIVIAPFEAHRFLFKEYRKVDLFSDVKFLTLDDAINNSTFPLTNESIKFLIKKLSVNYGTAKKYLNIIRLLPLKRTDEKYSMLYSLKDELIKEQLISYNELFSYELANASIDVHYYSKNNPYLKRFLKGYKVNYIENDIPQLAIDEYVNNDEQLISVFDQIEELLSNGVPASKIFIYGLMEDDQTILDRLSKNYNLNVNNAYPMHIIDLAYASSLIYEFKGDIDELLSRIDESLYKDTLVSFFKDYYVEGIEPSLQRMVYLERANSITLLTSIFDEAIRVISKPIIDKDEYVFILNYAQGIVPHSLKDDDVIDDEDKKKLNIPTSEEENVAINEEFAMYLSSLGNIILCYPKQNYSNKLRLSPLASRLDQHIKKKDYTSKKKIYSSSEARLEYANILDVKRKYIYIDSLLDSYQKQLSIPYLEYDPSFKGVNHYFMLNAINLSYSQANEFAKCAYRYYLNQVLRLEKSDYPFAMTFGNLVHDVLANIDSDLDYEDLFAHSFKNKAKHFSERDLVFLPRLKDEFKKTFNFIKRFEKQVKCGSFLREKEYVVSLTENISLIGRIDKLIFSGDINDHVTIIDYKSGSESFKEEDLKYGFSMQLPVYSLIFSKHPDFADKSLVGIAIEPLLNDEAKKVYENDEESIEKNLRLNGRFLADLSILYELDGSLDVGTSSKYLTSVGLKKDGSFKSSPSLYSPSNFADIAAIAYEHLLFTGENILSNNFLINPKIIKGKNVSCQYCPFRDICFRTVKQFVFISNEEKEDN